MILNRKNVSIATGSVILSAFFFHANVALSMGPFYSCQYTMAGGGNSTVAGCSMGAFEAASSKDALDRCLGLTSSKEGMISGKDCCALARESNAHIPKKSKIEVRVTITTNKQEPGPKGFCK